jgi:hypothetical protein
MLVDCGDSRLGDPIWGQVLLVGHGWFTCDDDDDDDGVVNITMSGATAACM